MPRFVALVRGVNVGKGRRVPMPLFKSMLQGMGYSDVSTLLNSGNAVFTSAARSQRKHETAIAAVLQEALQVSAPVIVKSAADWSAVLAASPIRPPEADHARYLVALAAEEEALSELRALRELAQDHERFVVTPVAAFLHCPAGISQSRIAEALLGRAGRRVTTRNWATALKLAALLGVGVA
jgi:uncharacterized protein (DUF1697 family)